MNDLELLKVYHFDNKIRLGLKKDGGYIFGDIGPIYDCYISAGIGNEESFSEAFINKYHITGYGFDGTISKYPSRYTHKISFTRKNINNFNDDNNTDLSDLLEKYNSIFLKMDIEGGEYPWLLSIDKGKLERFKQIVIEFHGITDNGWGCNYSDKIKCLKKLSDTHYIVHAHGNNNAHTNNRIPDVIELTYINKNYFEATPNLNRVKLPINNLDFPNKENTPDIELNFYPFVN